MTISQRQFCLLPERSHQRCAALHGAEASARVGLQIGHVDGTAIGQLVMLEVPPDVFGGVELRGIRRQRFDLHRTLERFEVLAHERAAMDRGTVPDNQQPLSYLLTQRVQELDDLRPFDGAGKEPEVEASEGNARDNRELMPIEVILQDRGLPFGRPGLHPRGPLAQSRLVDEDDDSALSCGVFFRAGQRSRFQRAMAGSLRSSARELGRWEENPSAVSIRPTWLSLYRCPLCRSISTPTRESVHRSVGKPSASAPCNNALSNSARCCSLNLEGRPRTPAMRPSNPSFCRSWFQVLTVVRVTPTRRATSAWATPLSSSRPARMRRRCRSFAIFSDLRIDPPPNMQHHVGQRISAQVASHLRKSQ